MIIIIIIDTFSSLYWQEKRRMAKRIATMLLSKNNSQSYPSNMASDLTQGNRSSSTSDIPDSPFISTNPEPAMRSSSSYYLRARDMEITKTLSLRSLTSIVSLKKDLAPGRSSKSKPKAGEPILVSARPRASRSGSLNAIYYSIDASTKEKLMAHSEVSNFVLHCSC